MKSDNANDRDHLTLGQFARRVLVFIVVVALALFVWQIVDALLLAFVGLLLAVLLRTLAGPIGRHTPIPMRWAVLIVLVLLVGLVALLVLFAGPGISQQARQFVETVPSSVEQIKTTLGRYGWGRYLLQSAEPTQWSMGQGISLFSRITGAASTVFTVAANVVLILFTAIYFAFNPDVYRRGIVLLVPKSKSTRIEEAFDATARTLRHWLLGQLISMASVGLLTTVGLWLAGVPLALLLGLITGLLEFVPIIGPVVAAIPGVLIGLTQGWRTALYASLVYVLVQQLENHAITPLVQRRAVELPPALVILAVVALGLLFGLLGVLVATPLTAVIVVWVRMLYVEDVLGKSPAPK